MGKRDRLNERGAALVMVLFLLVICAVSVNAIMGYTASQTRFLVANNDRVAAQYLAEAAIKTATANVINVLKDPTCDYKLTTTTMPLLTLAPTTVAMPNGSYVISYQPDSNDPLLASEIRITTIATVNGRNYTGRAIVALANSPWAAPGPGVVDLFNGAMYSHVAAYRTTKQYEKSWVVTPADPANGRPVATASPPDATGNFQVKFNNSYTQEAISIDCNGACKNFEGYNDPSGYGIYYGMTGTADNPDAYVLQYDPGAGANGSFFVKRLVARTQIPEYAYSNEYNCAKNAYYGNARVWNGKKWVTTTTSNPSNCDVPFEPTANYSSNPNDGQNVTWVSLAGTGPNSLTTIMQNATGRTFDVKAEHAITIETTASGQHRIYCDDVLILHFVDTTTKKKSFVGTSAGLRTWNAEIGFSNNPGSSFGDVSKATIVWQRN